MKAVLEFNLPEDEAGYKLAQNGLTYWCALHGFNEFIIRLAREKDFEFKPNQAEIVDHILSRWVDETGEINWDEIP